MYVCIVIVCVCVCVCACRAKYLTQSSQGIYQAWMRFAHKGKVDGEEIARNF